MADRIVRLTPTGLRKLNEGEPVQVPLDDGEVLELRPPMGGADG